MANGLLGMGGLGGMPMPGNSLLGDLYDPKAARNYQMKQMLLGLGLGLMSEKGVGRGAELALAMGNRAGEDYRQNAFDAYRLKSADEDRAYRRERDAKEDARLARQDARTNTEFGWKMDEQQRAEDLRAGQESAVDAWANTFKSQGGDLFDPGMQGWLRSQGVAGVNPADTQRYGNMQPYMQAGDYAGAFQQMTAEQPTLDAPNVQTIYGPDGREMKVQFINGQWVPLGGTKAPSNGITIAPDGTVQIGGGKPLTEGQSKDTVYSTRAEGALPYIDNGSDALTSMGQVGMDAIPFVGNYFTSSDYQVASSAGKEFLQALLRKDTGATIQPFEIQEYGSVYLPQPGDTPERLAYKKEARHRALAAMKAGMPPQAILAQEKALVASSGSGGAAPEADVNSEIDSLLELYGGQ